MKTVGPLKWEGGWVSLRERELSWELFSTPPDTNRGLASAKQPLLPYRNPSMERLPFQNGN